MSHHEDRENAAQRAGEWLRTAGLDEVASALQNAAYDMVQRGQTPEAAQHLYEASVSLRAAHRAQDGASTRRTYCMFCKGITLGDPPMAGCKWPSGHLAPNMEPYVAPPALNKLAALLTFADRYAGTPWYAGADQARDGREALVVGHWDGVAPPADVGQPWHGFAVEFKAVERRGY